MEAITSVVVLKGVDENYRYVTGVADHLIRVETTILRTPDDPRADIGSSE